MVRVFGVVFRCALLLVFELVDPMNAVSSGDAPPAWTESNILDVDDCNDDVDFLAVAALS